MYKLTRKRLIIDLFAAYQDAKRHKSNKTYVKSFGKNLNNNIETLANELIAGTYEPSTSSCFIIERPKKREVFAATFRDRIVHHLYFNYTHQIFERTFIEDSYSCIRNKGTLYGIKRLEKHIRKESFNYTHPCYVLKIDIKGYFMHINREKLFDITVGTIRKMAKHRVSKHSTQSWEDVVDIDFIILLTKKIALFSPIDNYRFSCNRNCWVGLDYNKSLFNTPKGCGLPIGNLTSQLFSNVYLNTYDQYMKRILKCKHYGRYVDDSYIVSCDREWLLSIIPQIRTFLLEELGLDVHMGKLTITDISKGVEFLGAFIKPYRIYASNHSINRMLFNIRKMDLRLKKEVWCSVNSYLGILSHYASYNIRCNIFMKKDFLSIGSFNRQMTKMIKPT